MEKEVNSVTFDSQFQLFEFLKDKYKCLQRYILLLKEFNPTCAKILQDNKGPVQFLNCCSKLLFYKDEFNCSWNENDVAQQINKAECLNLQDIGMEFLCDSSSMKKVNSGKIFLKAKQPIRCTHLYIGDDVIRIKKHVRRYICEKHQNTLTAYDGIMLIPEYMKLLTKNNIEEYQHIHLKECIDNWSVYALVLAAECIRSISILLYPYLFSKKDTLLAWDMSCVQLQHKLSHLEHSLQLLRTLKDQQAISSTDKKRLISIISSEKDSTIRLGLCIDVLEPLDKYGDVTWHIMNNRYMFKSDVYALLKYLEMKEVNQESVMFDPNFWKTNMILNIKNSTNNLNHICFYEM